MLSTQRKTLSVSVNFLFGQATLAIWLTRKEKTEGLVDVIWSVEYAHHTFRNNVQVFQNKLPVAMFW